MTDLEELVKGRDECWRDLVKMKNLFIEHVKDEDLSDEAVKSIAKVIAAEFALEHKQLFGFAE